MSLYIIIISIGYVFLDKRWYVGLREATIIPAHYSWSISHILNSNILNYENHNFFFMYKVLLTVLIPFERNNNKRFWLKHWLRLHQQLITHSCGAKRKKNEKNRGVCFNEQRPQSRRPRSQTEHEWMKKKGSSFSKYWAVLVKSLKGTLKGPVCISCGLPQLPPTWECKTKKNIHLMS